MPIERTGIANTIEKPWAVDSASANRHHSGDQHRPVADHRGVAPRFQNDRVPDEQRDRQAVTWRR